MPKTVSNRSTKQEILDAYEELTKELKDMDTQSISSLPAQPKKDTPSQTPDQIVNRLGELRLQVNKNLAEIVDKLVTESETLAELRTEEQNLRGQIETLHRIKAEASTLENLIKLKEQEEKELNEKIQSIKDDWAEQQERHQKDLKEQAAEEDKRHKREDEEYHYTLKMKRQKEEDEYQAKRREAEGELTRRAQELRAREEEFEVLQKRVVDLEKQLETEVTRVRKETEDTVKHDLENKYNLERKEIDGERKVSKLTIENLQRTITAQDVEIKDLKEQLARATQQIKDIAVSVIDSKKPVYPPMNQNKSNE